MRFVPRGWHTETWVCSMRGHVAPAAKVERLRPEDRRVGVVVEPNDRLVRCLRCDMWLEVLDPAPGPDVPDVLPPLDELPLPRRGKVLQEAVLLRLIAINKALHSFIFGTLAIGLTVLELKLPGLQHSARLLDRRLRATIDQTGQEPSRDRFGDALHRVIGLHRSAILVLILTAAAYCIVEGIEAFGLWKERRWAEYLTALATAGLLPLEVHELIERITVFRVLALGVNVAILVWLVLNKHLFGVKGGPKTLHHEVDTAAILERPTPAAHA